MNQFIHFGFTQATDPEGRGLWQCRACGHVATETMGRPIVVCREIDCLGRPRQLYILTIGGNPS